MSSAVRAKRQLMWAPVRSHGDALCSLVPVAALFLLPPTACLHASTAAHSSSLSSAIASIPTP